MNIPDDLEITDPAGNARRNGEERKAINFLLQCERERWATKESSAGSANPESVLETLRKRQTLAGADLGGWSAKPGAFYSIGSLAPNVTSVAPWSAAARPSEDETPEGTVWEKFGPDNPFVMVKQVRGWMQVRREESAVAAMVAEDENRTGEA